MTHSVLTTSLLLALAFNCIDSVRGDVLATVPRSPAPDTHNLLCYWQSPEGQIVNLESICGISPPPVQGNAPIAPTSAPAATPPAPGTETTAIAQPYDPNQPTSEPSAYDPNQPIALPSSYNPNQPTSEPSSYDPNAKPTGNF